MRHRMRRTHAWIWTGAALLAAALAVAGIGSAVAIEAKAVCAQALLRMAWERARAGAIDPRPWPWADTHPLARLEAPSQQVDMIVLSGASARTLAFGPGHHDGSAAPGEEGNTVLTGHRDTHFRFLQALAPGAALVLESRRGVRERFVVRTTAVADYRTLALPRDTATRTLTLVTCYPFDAIAPGGPLRYLVTATAE
jgi:sortase A